MAPLDLATSWFTRLKITRNVHCLRDVLTSANRVCGQSVCGRGRLSDSPFLLGLPRVRTSASLHRLIRHAVPVRILLREDVAN